MKRLIAALMCIALLLGLAACSQPAGQQAGGNTGEVKEPDVFGMLLLGMNATVSVSYDKDGLVLSVAGENEMGEEIAADFTKVLGSSCSKVVTDLIKAISDSTYATEQKVVVLKQARGSQNPTENFLEGIRLEAEKAAADRAVVLATADTLTDDDFLSLDTAKEILGKHLALEDATMEGDPEMVNDKYWITVTYDNTTEEYTVDAVNGLVEAVPSEEGFVESPDGPTDEFYDPTMDMTDDTEPFDPFEGMDDIIFDDEGATGDATEDTTAGV